MKQLIFLLEEHPSNSTGKLVSCLLRGETEGKSHLPLSPQFTGKSLGKKKSHARKQWCTELSAPPLLRSSEDLQAQWQLESLVFLGFPNFPQRTSPLFSVWCEMINSLKRHRELRRSEDSFLCLLHDKMGKKHFVTPSGVCACLPVCYLPEYQLFIYYISPIIYLSSVYPLCIDHLFTCLSVIYLYYQLYIMYYISLSFD